MEGHGRQILADLQLASLHRVQIVFDILSLVKYTVKDSGSYLLISQSWKFHVVISIFL